MTTTNTPVVENLLNEKRLQEEEEEEFRKIVPQSVSDKIMELTKNAGYDEDHEEHDAKLVETMKTYYPEYYDKVMKIMMK